MNVAELSARLSLETDKGSFKKGDGLISGVKRALGALAAAASVRWFAGVINGVVQTADKLDELSQQTGVNVESLQALGYAAGFSGVSTESLAGSLGKLSKNAAAAAKGSKEQGRAFRAVGVDAKAFLSGALPVEDALGKIASKFQKMKDGPKKAALAMTLFGRSGKELIPFLNAGPKGIAELTKEARELGVVIDAQHVKEMANLADDQDRLKAGWQGVKNEIAIALLPTLRDLTKDLLAWVKANRKLIASKVVSFVKTLGVALKIVATAVETIGDVLSWLADILGISTEELGGMILALKLLGPVAMSAGGMLTAAFGSAALPIALVAALIAGVIYVLSEMTFDEVKQKVMDFINWAVDVAGRLKEWFKTKVVDWVADKALDAVDAIGRAFPDTGDTNEKAAAKDQAAQAAYDAQYAKVMQQAEFARHGITKSPDNLQREGARALEQREKDAMRAARGGPSAGMVSAAAAPTHDDSGAKRTGGMTMDEQVAAAEAYFEAKQKAGGGPVPQSVVTATMTNTITVNEAVNARETARMIDDQIRDSIAAMVDSGSISADEGRYRTSDAIAREKARRDAGSDEGEK